MANKNPCPECGENNWMPEGEFAMFEVRGGSIELNMDSMTTASCTVEVSKCLNCRFVKLFSTT